MNVPLEGFPPWHSNQAQGARPSSAAAAFANVAQTIAAELSAAGIRHLFYVPGGPMMPFVNAACETQLFQFVLCKHEQGAGFMAEGLARAQRQPCVVLVTAGPGVTNVTTPVYVALREMTPLFVLSAQISTAASGKGAAQELDTALLLRPITKLSVALTSPRTTSAVVRRMFDECERGAPGPVHLSVPCNLWLQVTS